MTQLYDIRLTSLGSGKIFRENVEVIARPNDVILYSDAHEEGGEGVTNQTGKHQEVYLPVPQVSLEPPFFGDAPLAPFFALFLTRLIVRPEVAYQVTGGRPLVVELA